MSQQGDSSIPVQGIDADTGLPDEAAISQVAQLFDVPALQSMMDDFYGITSIPSAVIDLEGIVIVGSGWQDICTQFHRVNPESCANCIESDTVLTADIPAGESKLYQCKNGMWDAAMPITVNGTRVANVFTGQFFLGDTPIDEDFFGRQAQKYGFNEAEYLAALRDVPRLSRSTVEMGLDFLTKLTSMLSRMGLLYSLERERARFGEALAEIDLALHSSSGFDEVMGRALSEGAQALGADTGAVSMHEPGHFIVSYVWGWPAEVIGGIVPDELDTHGVLALQTRRPVVIQDTPTDARVVPSLMDDWGITAVIAVPLIVRGEGVAVLYYNFTDGPHSFTEPEVEFASKIGASMSLAMENAELVDSLQQELGRTSLLEDVALATSGGPDLERMAESVLTALGRHILLKGGDIRIVRGDRLILASAFNYPPENVELIRNVDFAQSGLLGARAVRERRTLTHEDEDLTPERVAVLRRQGILEDRYVYMPIPYRDEIVGLLSLTFGGRRRFAADELSLYSSLCQAIVPAIENARLFERTREDARLSAALNAANASIHSTLDIDEVMQHALETGVRALGCDSGAVEMLDRDEWVVRYEYGLGPGAVGIRLSKREAPNATLAASRCAPIAIDDLSHAPELNVGFAKQFGLKSVLAMPLTSRGEVIGCALFYTDKGTRQYTDAEIDFVRKLGSAVSLSLENARLYEGERRIAETLQEALLALPGDVPGIVFDSAYRSATEMTLVGGDFYDVFALAPNQIGITIGDISGKGLSAAVLTSLVKDTIRAHASESWKTPAKILGLTNEVLYHATSTETFATVFFAILDTRDGQLRYANAGHTTGAVIRADGTTSKLATTGPIIGGFQGVVFDESTATVGAGDVVFLYTDGLTEARCDGKLYGEERLFEFLSTLGAEAPGDVVDEVVLDVMVCASNHLRDDLAILAVGRAQP
jgi:GAF domain-containing protein/ligand-binding sensor protein